MGRGEYLEERLPELEDAIETHFGEISRTDEYKGNDLHIVEDPENPVFERVEVGKVEYSGQKDKLAVDITERNLEEVLSEGHTDAAGAAVETKNSFLETATGRDAKSRRDSLKRQVEDDAPDY